MALREVFRYFCGKQKVAQERSLPIGTAESARTPIEALGSLDHIEFFASITIAGESDGDVALFEVIP